MFSRGFFCLTTSVLLFGQLFFVIGFFEISGEASAGRCGCCGDGPRGQAVLNVEERGRPALGWHILLPIFCQ